MTFHDPEVVEVYVFNAVGNGSDGSDYFAEDAPLVRQPAKILSVAGIIVYCKKNGMLKVEFEFSVSEIPERYLSNADTTAFEYGWQRMSSKFECQKNAYRRYCYRLPYCWPIRCCEPGLSWYFQYC